MPEEVKAWNWSLEEVYPTLYLDALVVEVKDHHQLGTRPPHRGRGDPDGVKHALGSGCRREGAKFWGGVLAELETAGPKC